MAVCHRLGHFRAQRGPMPALPHLWLTEKVLLVVIEVRRHEPRIVFAGGRLKRRQTPSPSLLHEFLVLFANPVNESVDGEVVDQRPVSFNSFLGLTVTAFRSLVPVSGNFLAVQRLP